MTSTTTCGECKYRPPGGGESSTRSSDRLPAPRWTGPSAMGVSLCRRHGRSEVRTHRQDPSCLGRRGGIGESACQRYGSERTRAGCLHERHQLRTAAESRTAAGSRARPRAANRGTARSNQGRSFGFSADEAAFTATRRATRPGWTLAGAADVHQSHGLAGEEIGDRDTLARPDKRDRQAPADHRQRRRTGDSGRSITGTTAPLRR